MNRVEDMKKMRGERRSLEEIGEKHGVSRERVRQLIGNTGKVLDKYSSRVYKPRLVNKNRGSEFEKLVFDRLVEIGLNPVMQPQRAPFDILVNGFRVDVKGSSSKGKYHQFRFDADKRCDCDFFVLVVCGRFFVVPFSVVSGTSGTMSKIDKWTKYENMFSYLEVIC